MIRLLIWVVVVAVITTVVIFTGLDLPAAFGVAISGVFISRELDRWLLWGEAPPELPDMA